MMGHPGAVVLAGKIQSTPTVSATRPTTRVRRAWARGWPAGYGAGLGALLFLVAHDALPDDGLISLSFARNLAEHGQWALTTGVEANTATSPLNVWLLAALIIVTGSQAFVAAGLLLAGCLAVSAAWLHRLGGAWASLLGTALLATSPVLTSSIGLETYLGAAVVVGLVRYTAAGRLAPSTVLTAGALLTRPDLVVPALVIVGLGAISSRRTLLALPLGAVLAAPWYLFSWWHFGSAWPDSVALKWAANGWNGGTLFITSLDYFYGTFRLPSMQIAATVVMGLVALAVALRRRMWPVVALCSAGAAHYLALAVTDAPPIEYYLGPMVTGLGLGAAVLAGRVTGREALSWRVVVGATVAAAVALSVAHGSLWQDGFAPMRQNWATDAEYAAIVDDLPTDGVIHASTEIGALAFYCQDRGCTVLDQLLAYPAGVDRYVDRWRRFHPSAEINYRFHEQPALIPGRYQLDYQSVPPGPGDWWITRSPGFRQSAHLSPAPEGFTGALLPLP